MRPPSAAQCPSCALADAMAGDRVVRMEAVLNGTTNAVRGWKSPVAARRRDCRGLRRGIRDVDPRPISRHGRSREARHPLRARLGPRVLPAQIETKTTAHVSQEDFLMRPMAASSASWRTPAIADGRRSRVGDAAVCRRRRSSRGSPVQNGAVVVGRTRARSATGRRRGDARRWRRCRSDGPPRAIVGNRAGAGPIEPGPPAACPIKNCEHKGGRVSALIGLQTSVQGHVRGGGHLRPRQMPRSARAGMTTPRSR